MAKNRSGTKPFDNVPSTQILTPEDFKGDMQNLSDFVQREVSAAENCRRPLEPRWKVCEQLYRMEPNSAGNEIIEGVEIQPDSVGREVCQRIATSGRQALFSPYPIMQALPDGNTMVEAEDLEKGMQTLLEKSRVDVQFGRSLLQTTLSNRAIMRVRPTSRGEIEVSRIHPQDFVMGPNYDIDLKDAHLAGHRTYLAGWRIAEAMQNPNKEQRWRECEFRAGSPESTDVTKSTVMRKSLPNQFGESEVYQLVQVMELIMRLPVKRDGKITMEMWILVHLPDSMNTVYAMPYPVELVRPWYFDICFEREEGTWWAETSVMNTIQGYANDMTDLKNCVVQGAKLKAFPPAILSGGGFKDKDIIYKPGHFYLFDQGVESTVIQTGVDIGDCMSAREELRQNVFGMTGISQMGTGQELKSGATATEASQLGAVQQQSENVYASQAGETLEQIAEMIQLYCMMYPASINSFYGDSLTDAFWENVWTPVRWVSTGKSADNSPAALIAKFEQLKGLADDPEYGIIKHQLASMMISALNLNVDKSKVQLSEDDTQIMIEAYKQQMAEAQMAQGGAVGMVPEQTGLASMDMPNAA